MSGKRFKKPTIKKANKIKSAEPLTPAPAVAIIEDSRTKSGLTEQIFRILVNLATLFGLAATLLGWIKPVVGAFWILAGLGYVAWELTPRFKNFVQRSPKMSLLVFVICGALAGGLSGGLYWALVLKTPPGSGEPHPMQASAAPATPPTPKSSSVFDSTVAEWRLARQPESLQLHDLFLTDFKPIQQQSYGAIFVDDARTISVQYGINIDLALRSKFLTFYVERQDKHTADVCAYLAEHYQFVLDKSPQMLIEQKTPGDSETVSTKEAVFSNRIYVYHETYLPADVTVGLTNLYRQRGLSVILRSTDYLANKKLEAQVRMLRSTQAAR